MIHLGMAVAPLAEECIKSHSASAQLPPRLGALSCLGLGSQDLKPLCAQASSVESVLPAVPKTLWVGYSELNSRDRPENQHFGRDMLSGAWFSPLSGSAVTGGASGKPGFLPATCGTCSWGAWGSHSFTCFLSLCCLEALPRPRFLGPWSWVSSARYIYLFQYVVPVSLPLACSEDSVTSRHQLQMMPPTWPKHILKSWALILWWPGEPPGVSASGDLPCLLSLTGPPNPSPYHLLDTVTAAGLGMSVRPSGLWTAERSDYLFFMHCFPNTQPKM